MRPKSSNRIAPLAFVLLGVMGLAVLVTPWWLQAGGPLITGGGASGFGVEGLAFTWPNQPISYTTDGGALGQLDNATANARVAFLFNVWQAVPTSNIVFLRSGGVPPTDSTATVWAIDDTPAATEFVDQTVEFDNATNSDFRPFDFAAAEAIGDYSAFGFAQKFHKLRMDNLNGVQGVGGVVAWEYFNGTIWTALAGVTDGTAGFTAAVADGQVVTFTVPADWEKTSVNGGAQLFYVRARVTTVFSTNPRYDQGKVVVLDGDIDTVVEYNALVCTGNPVVYDADGQLFIDLGKGTNVLGFAGPCFVNQVPVNSITSGRIALNGRWFDGNGANGELTSNAFDAVFIHEFGHFFGMDHSQISKECLGGGCLDFSEESFGLPTMFPILLSTLEETAGVHPARTLSADDIAWVSRLYPDATFNTTFGSITGTVFFSDGVTALQGANVIARQVDDPATTTIDESKRNAVSASSGFFFRANHGNTALPIPNVATNFGSGNVSFAGTFEIPGLAPGNYTVEIETLNTAFTGGSSVGPVGNDRNVQFPLPGPAEFYNVGESNIDTPATSSPVSVTAGAATTGINIIVNGTGPRFDSFDAAVRNDSTATATPLNNGAHAASLSPFTSRGDLDIYAFNATSGATVTVDIRSQRDLGTQMDSVVEIVDGVGVGNQLTTCSATIGGIFNTTCVNDFSSAGGTVDSTIHFQPASTGTFYVRVSEKYGDARPEFLYNLVLTGADPAPVGGAVFSNIAAVTIPSSGVATTYPSNITVSGVTGTVTKVVVRLINLNHTAPDDLDILLVGPTGANAIILSDVGGITDAVDVILGLDDDAATVLPNGGPLVSGIFQPTNINPTVETFPGPAPTPSGNVALSVFAGLNPNGIWSLYIVDDLGLDSGSLSGGWSLEIFATGGKKRRGQITSE